MSKKDYELIAAILRAARNRIAKNSHLETVRFGVMVGEFCSILKRKNPRFSSYKFNAAVYIDEVGAAEFLE